MDKRIERKSWSATRIAVVLIAIVLAVFLFVAFSSGKRTSLTIDPQRISTARVEAGQFEEYVPVLGTVLPKVSVYLDLEEGGIVRRIYVEAGNPVKAGERILDFANTTAQKENIDSETRLLENLDRMRSSKIALTEKNLLLKEQLLDLNYEIAELQKTFDRYVELDKGSLALPRQEFETTRDNLAYLREKRTLLQERIVQESALREAQNEQIDKSIILVNESLDVLSEIKRRLNVLAPIDGYLSSMDAEIGQSFGRGERIGQIDQLDEFKVRANVDQFFISKVAVGQRATFEFGGETYEIEVSKIYPDVREDEFQIDLQFAGPPAEGIKRGQTLQIDLSLSKSDTSRMVRKGGFYRYTNGRWAYRVASDGMSAERVEIVPGRQNPRHFEILEGIEVGDVLITSSYESFGDVDVLNFDSPIRR